jgi:intracellular septation protein
MQLLVDFIPIIIFFVAYKLYGMYVATAAIMIAISIQIAVQWFTKRTVNKMLLVSGVLVLIFGGITLALRDPLFIQWKLTVVDGLFAIAFLLSRYIGKQTLVERIMGHAIELPQSMWRQLNMMWVGNFAFLAIANVYVIYNFSEEFWVNFKVWGTLGFTIVIALIQGIWIARTLPPEQQEGQS